MSETSIPYNRNGSKQDYSDAALSGLGRQKPETPEDRRSFRQAVGIAEKQFAPPEMPGEE